MKDDEKEIEHLIKKIKVGGKNCWFKTQPTGIAKKNNKERIVSLRKIIKRFFLLQFLKLKNSFNEKSNYLAKIIEYYFYISNFKNVIINYEKLQQITDSNTIKELKILDYVISSYYNLGRYKEIINLLKHELINKDDLIFFDEYSLYSLLAMCMHLTGNSIEAKEILENLINKEQCDITKKCVLYLQIAHICIDNKQFIDFNNNIEKALDYMNKECNFYLFSILVLLFLEENNKIITKKILKIRKILNNNLNYEKILYIADEMKLTAEDTKKMFFYKIAISFYKQLFLYKHKRYINIEEILYSLSKSYYEIEKYHNASRYLNLLIKISKLSDKISLYLLLANAYYKQQKYEQAIVIFEMLLKDSRICLGRIYYNLSYCYFYNKQYDKAKQAIKHAMNENDLEEENIIQLKELQTNIENI